MLIRSCDMFQNLLNLNFFVLFIYTSKETEEGKHFFCAHSKNTRMSLSREHVTCKVKLGK